MLTSTNQGCKTRIPVSLLSRDRGRLTDGKKETSRNKQNSILEKYIIYNTFEFGMYRIIYIYENKKYLHEYIIENVENENFKRRRKLRSNNFVVTLISNK